MAELMDKGGKGGKGKQKKRATKVDMTAMVDVAFLLLTFFILTTTMATSRTMELNVPPKKKTQDQESEVDVKASTVLTLILGEKDKVYWFVGIEDPALGIADFSDGDKGVRKAILNHLNKGKKKGQPFCKGKESTKGCWDPIIVIKPNKTSRYRNVVDILDEMSITEAPKYALTKMTPGDSLILLREEVQ